MGLCCGKGKVKDKSYLCSGKGKATDCSRSLSLDKKELKTLEIETQTRFTQEELKDWYRTFNSTYPGGVVTKQEFKHVYKLAFPETNVDAFSDFIFQFSDKNCDGVLDYKEYIVGLTLTAKSDLDEKLRWAFSFYDEDNNGFITRNELYDVFKAFDKISPDDEETATLDQRVDAMFKLLDKDRDDKITIDEFVEGVKKNKAMKRMTGT